MRFDVVLVLGVPSAGEEERQEGRCVTTMLLRSWLTTAQECAKPASQVMTLLGPSSPPSSADQDIR